jgi:plasmid rolling circle replication initiator protein Rep
MFTIYYNKKITKLQLELYNFLSKEHNPALEFFISFLIFILEKLLKVTEVIKDIVIMPFFQVLSFFIMLIVLLFNVITSNPNITTIHTNTAFINSTVINIAETNFKSHILAFINASDNIPPPIPIKEEIQPNKAVKIEEKEKIVDEIENIINPYIKIATEKKREQLKTLDNFKGTLLDLDKIKNCAVDLTIPNTSKPIIHYCNNRFCPTCSFIKSGKNADIIRKVLMKARADKKTLIYGTFTTKNVTADNLTAEIEKINTAFTKTLTIPKKMKDNIVGYVKKLEIKFNEARNDYNVHIHTVIAVSNYYKNHIGIDEYHDYFKRYTKDESIIKPDIKVIGNTDKDITKVANYISKEDLIQNMLHSDEVSDNIYNAVKNKRILEFCLEFRQLKKEVENTLTINKVSIRKNQMPILTTLTWNDKKKIYIS